MKEIHLPQAVTIVERSFNERIDELHTALELYRSDTRLLLRHCLMKEYRQLPHTVMNRYADKLHHYMQKSCELTLIQSLSKDREPYFTDYSHGVAAELYALWGNAEAIPPRPEPAINPFRSIRRFLSRTDTSSSQESNLPVVTPTSPRVIERKMKDWYGYQNPQGTTPPHHIYVQLSRDVFADELEAGYKQLADQILRP